MNKKQEIAIDIFKKMCPEWDNYYMIFPYRISSTKRIEVKICAEVIVKAIKKEIKLK